MQIFWSNAKRRWKRLHGSLGVLNDDQENRKMLTKLPKWLVDRWGRTVYQWKAENGNFLPFSTFVRFLVKESDIACDPVTSSQALRDEENKKLKEPDKPFKPRFDRRAHGASTFATSSWHGHNETGRQEGQQSLGQIMLCKKPHDLDVCYEFLKKTIQERKEFARTKGLCFGCLIRQGHRAKECNQGKTCTTCGKSHPTSLHGDSRKPYSSSTTHCTKAYKNQSNSMIFPVWLHHLHDPENAKPVYAILHDDQSDTTFVNQRTVEQLGVSGPETHLSLSTMHAENATVVSQRIKGLVVSDSIVKSPLNFPEPFQARKSQPEESRFHDLRR